ncbi:MULTISPECIES: hypothetical protein [Lentibacillus]|nr:MULTISPECIES: hypothetical protein [Lentibacillus]
MEADYSADPLWCSKCGCNLDIDDFPLSDELKSELMNWVIEYGEILEQTDYGEKIKRDTAILVKSHDEKGLSLYQKLKFELGDGHEVNYVHTSL